MVQTAQGILQKAGIKTVYSQVFPAENPDYKAGADQVAATGAQMVVLGSVDVPTVTAFITAFEQQHYNPKILAAAPVPTRVPRSFKAVGPSNATGIMVPNGWYAGLTNSAEPGLRHGLQRQVRRHAGRHQRRLGRGLLGGPDHRAGGRPRPRASTTPRSSRGCTATSPLRCKDLRRTTTSARMWWPSKYIFQWQHGAKFVQVLPAGAPGSVAIVNPRPDWGQG